ncbi:MAG: aldo/keto reductase [Desulfobacteraceae bacterium]|jgi:predicted aldo/keto reductase-like oxidoreductase|nr:aldo/keto reductase [Desulfobacteraceae bacterium]
MNRKSNTGWTRRQFLHTAGAAGVGAVIGGDRSTQAAEEEPVRVPRRPFGRSEKMVSILSLGGMFDIPNNQLLMRQAHRWGVTYWDTADCYGRGRSEEGIGKYFSKFPEHRADVFLVTKSDDRDPEGMSRLLERSLRRMNTDFIDLYFVHGVRNVRREIDDETRRWAEKAKSEGKIRLFGFSTHSNMESCLAEAAGMGWIDGIMMTYNYRLMHETAMAEAVQACTEAGIGLTAMKTQGGGPVTTESESELEMAGRFVKKGFTDRQARLKAVWEDRRIASICSQMPNMTILMANVAAAVDRTSLSMEDRRLLQRHARETASGYCSGCSDICESAVAGRVPIGDILRYVMYYHEYREPELARSLYRQLPEAVRYRIRNGDFTRAENRCPRSLRIGAILHEADRLLS